MIYTKIQNEVEAPVNPNEDQPAMEPQKPGEVIIIPKPEKEVEAEPQTDGDAQ